MLKMWLKFNNDDLCEFGLQDERSTSEGKWRKVWLEGSRELVVGYIIKLTRLRLGLLLFMLVAWYNNSLPCFKPKNPRAEAIFFFCFFENHH